MAASRWKRFAFFDRNNLTFHPDVVSDLIPGGVDTLSGRRLSSLGVDDDDMISMTVSTASLPVMTKPSSTSTNESEDAPSNAMWGSLTACMAPQVSDGTVKLPSQALLLEGTLGSPSSSKSADGLVLVFLASQESDKVHCVDVTVRCNPSNNLAHNASEEEALDGWRGYWTPFCKDEKTNLSSRLEDRIISDHMSGNDRVVALATCRQADGKLWVACLSNSNLIVCEDPHLGLSCRIPLASSAMATDTVSYKLALPWNVAALGSAQCVDVTPGGLVAVGTDSGAVHVFTVQKGFLRAVMTIPSVAQNQQVATVQWSVSPQKAFLFVVYQHKRSGPRVSSRGTCCYDLGSPTSVSPPQARHDLDSRPVISSRLCDATNNQNFLVARADGLYTYSPTQKSSVSPINGIKLAICNVPSYSKSTNNDATIGASYALVASTDAKSGRDAVDIYDAANKLVAFHVLLSPSHKALQAVGVATLPTQAADGSLRGGRSSAIVLTSGGALVTLTEKITAEKVSLLTQKNLYGAAISMAFADPSYQPAEISSLYRRHAEHLYRKGDFSAAMDQYIYTIGSLESSHVIFRYLDAPKIPMLAKYLEELRSRDLATAVHNELLRTCYLKLGDNEAAERIAALGSSAVDSETCASIVASLTHNPKEALATVCSFEAPQAAEALVIYGAALARALPRETAGIVVSLCLGTYSPSAMAEAAGKATNEASRMLDYPTDNRERKCAPYPVHLFAFAFLENPKMLRIVLAHCSRNKCPLTPTLRRTLLELTLSEWNSAKRSGDTEAEKLRRKEAITALTDAHCRDIGDYDALVLVQLAGFAEGELLLYERLQMVPMLLSRYAQDGGDRARRQMLAMCRNDPEVLADVLGHFVEIASEKVKDENLDDASVNSEEQEILSDIREALSLAKSQGFLPPVRIARILAGEGTGQFSVENHRTDRNKRTVPLSVALDYVGEILDESRGDIARLTGEVEQYTDLCTSMEAEVEALLTGSSVDKPPANSNGEKGIAKVDIDELYSRLQSSLEERPKLVNKTMQSREGFWREMDQSDDRFETVARYFAKGLIQ